MPSASPSTTLSIARNVQLLAAQQLKLINDALLLREVWRNGFADFNLLTPTQLEQLGIIDQSSFSEFLDRMPDVQSTISNQCYPLKGTS
jgi:hypothetical protein